MVGRCAHIRGQPGGALGEDSEHLARGQSEGRQETQKGQRPWETQTRLALSSLGARLPTPRRSPTPSTC